MILYPEKKYPRRVRMLPEQRVKSPPERADDGPGDHELLTLPQFAKRRGISRQTAYKWKDQENGFPPKCLVRDHRQRWFVDWDVYKKAYVVVR